MTQNNKSVPIFNDAVQIQVRNRVLNNQAEEISKNERLSSVTVPNR